MAGVALNGDALHLHPGCEGAGGRAALADDVGLHGVRLHDLRHTMVSTLTEAGFDPRVIADRAGHTQITTTLGVYAHARPARDQDLAAHLAAQLDAG